MRKLFLTLLLTSGIVFASNLDKLKEKAQAGDVNSIMQLALKYESGDGVAQDIEMAKKYYSQAKELGSEDAKISLSLLELSNNQEIFKHLTNNVSIKSTTNLNYTISIDDLKELIKKAKKNDKDALFTLATLYDNGYGDLKADPQKAMLLYKKSAKLGNKKAQELLIIKSTK